MTADVGSEKHVNGSNETPATFSPTNRTHSKPNIFLPDELWLTVLESPCTFPFEVFSGVMLNLIKNPNVTSSHLFRADIFYDSENDRSLDHVNGKLNDDGLLKHIKPEYRPVNYELPGFSLTRTIVRQLVPRNPKLDRPLIQTCHLFSQSNSEGERNIVLYIPHVQSTQDIPFYHPCVRHLAFEHRWQQASHPQAEPAEYTSAEDSFSISVSYNLFPGTNLTTKLERTALRLLQTVHKHGQGQLAGYEKRVHLDQVVPQKRYQDTYTRLKTKYGKQLAEQWVEVTDPGKHVFEDIGIAAFLIELWRDMYRGPETTADERHENDSIHDRETGNLPQFPGFVDIGCGNGILVYILVAEGYEGWGFDARERKTWQIFPEHVQMRLQRRLLIPKIFEASASNELAGGVGTEEQYTTNGIFEPKGAFIISNHADELTAWTPLLAYMNRSSFIAIPCCSHDLAGSRFRAPASTKTNASLQKASTATARLPQQHNPADTNLERDQHGLNGNECQTNSQQAAETGSLKRTDAQKKMPSAYSTLCSYVISLTEELGDVEAVEKEVLRIPSTRNQSIIGRHSQIHDPSKRSDDSDYEVRRQVVVDVVERELGKSVAAVGAEWIARAVKLAKKPGSGH